jgi:hypothetical protein
LPSTRQESSHLHPVGPVNFMRTAKATSLLERSTTWPHFSPLALITSLASCSGMLCTAHQRRALAATARTGPVVLRTVAQCSLASRVRRTSPAQLASLGVRGRCPSRSGERRPPNPNDGLTKLNDVTSVLGVPDLGPRGAGIAGALQGLMATLGPKSGGSICEVDGPTQRALRRRSACGGVPGRSGVLRDRSVAAMGRRKWRSIGRTIAPSRTSGERCQAIGGVRSTAVRRSWTGT